MDVVHGPKKSNAVGDSVVNVPGKVVKNKCGEPTDERRGQFNKASVLVDHAHERERKKVPGEHIDEEPCNCDGQVREGVAVIPGLAPKFDVVSRTLGQKYEAVYGY